MEPCIARPKAPRERGFRGVGEDRRGTNILEKWKGSVIGEECSLHQIAPFIGKMKSSMAAALVSALTRRGHTVYDPFCGSGTVALEAWLRGRNVIANDLSRYAYVLTRAKLSPYATAEEALAEMRIVAARVKVVVRTVDLRRIPKWVRGFFHPETLRELVAWFQVLRARESDLLLSCLLGILHHERPGFLSYPSSHTAPYLRARKFPRELYPGLYQYREVQGRLERKLMRALKRVPKLDNRLVRECHRRSAAELVPRRSLDAIITSPPYMRQLDYARDNRLRLWFLGISDWNSLDKRISPAEPEFLSMMRKCLTLWRSVLKYKGVCALVLGDAVATTYDKSLPDTVAHIATSEIGDYSVLWRHTEPIPDGRRVRRGYSGSSEETILVLRNERAK